MKQNIHPAVAAVIIVVALALLIGWGIKATGPQHEPIKEPIDMSKMMRGGGSGGGAPGSGGTPGPGGAPGSAGAPGSGGAPASSGTAPGSAGTP
ncbi:MAG: hypothetical protein RMJ43_05150 [Chloroherpetonaceae bacterium]|nr:hypothetical protein [Chthonomonadaceae bacterium]MDW8207203.1 hypothetical protein [Chloroherpetonaceae bacterium]